MNFGNLQRDWTLGDGFILGDNMSLGAQVGRWGVFRTHARARKRRPKLSVFVEGVGSVTQYVKNFSFNRRIEGSLHEPTHGKGVIVLKDKDNVLIQNSRSVIRRNDKIQIWSGFAAPGFLHGDLVPRFAGIVKTPKINTATGQITLDVQDYGYLMKQAQTSGDWSAYNTPKLMVDELMSRLGLKAPNWENEAGLPTTYTIGNPILRRRNYWKKTHGALLGINYVMYFDENGDLQCKRRDNSAEADELFVDKDIGHIKYERMASLINSKGVSLDGVVTPFVSGTAGDSIRWGQSIYSKESEISQAQNGEVADYESEDMISGWSNVLPFSRDSVNWFQYPRHIISLHCAARPHLGIMDKIRIDSDRYNIHGQQTILGVSERCSAASYSQTLLLMSHRELF